MSKILILHARRSGGNALSNLISQNGPEEIPEPLPKLFPKDNFINIFKEKINKGNSVTHITPINLYEFYNKLNKKDEEAIDILFSDYKIIKLHRNNDIEQAISVLVCSMEQRYRSDQKICKEIKKEDYDPLFIRQVSKTIRQENKYIKKLNIKNCFETNYENIFYNQEEKYRLFDFLDMDLKVSEPKIKKYNNKLKTYFYFKYIIHDFR